MSDNILDVYFQDVFVGKLIQEKGLLSFTYDAFYRSRQGAFNLSTSLPITQETFSNTAVAYFFSGLLPEEGVRTRLARYLRISPRNTFALLKVIGGDCAGAVSLYPEGTTPADKAIPTYRVLEEGEAWDILSHLDKHPMLAGGQDIRMSGAGAQDKLMVSFVNNKIAIPTGSTPSTHIIKPQIREIPYSVHNEFFCMTLAKKMGLLVPHVSIFLLKQTPFYLIERYDRLTLMDGCTLRLHQEDFCQALHIAPEQKYENEGGPTLEMCFLLLDQKIRSGVMAGSHKISLLKAIIFNFLIGNGDAHGKNFSLLYEGTSESLAPSYDLMCTLVYTNAYKSQMAMKLGEKYQFTQIQMRQFEKLATLIGFRPSYVVQKVKAMSEEIVKTAQTLQKDLDADPQTSCPIYEKIVGVILKNAKQVL